MAQQPSSLGQQAPITNEEFTIQALTIHGAFFERKCQDAVRQVKDWTLRDTNYPVEHQGKASNLDIWAEKKVMGSKLFLPIECKKNNPDFVDWIFFSRSASNTAGLYTQAVEIQPQSGVIGNWTIQRQLLRIKYDLVVADEARETKGDYLSIKQRQDRTKTSNVAITEAATQVAIAAQSILRQELEVVEHISQSALQQFTPYAFLLCFPTIVTTANLYTCEFQETDISLSTGEIPWDKATLTKRPYLVFNYPLPVSLQSPSLVGGHRYEDYWDTLRNAARMPIFVVQSNAFPTFLERLMLPQSHNNGFGEVWYTLDLHPDTV